MAQLPCIGLLWPLTNRHLLGSCAIYFHHSVNTCFHWPGPCVSTPWVFVTGKEEQPHRPLASSVRSPKRAPMASHHARVHEGGWSYDTLPRCQVFRTTNLLVPSMGLVYLPTFYIPYIIAIIHVVGKYANVPCHGMGSCYCNRCPYSKQWARCCTSTTSKKRPRFLRKFNQKKITLPETNIAHENLIFPGQYHQNDGFPNGYVSLPGVIYHQRCQKSHGVFNLRFGKVTDLN